jgi:hypothetical protein
MHAGIKVSLAILIGAFAGPSIYGAAGSTMWKASSIDDDKGDVARRLYSRADLHPGYDAVVTYSSKDCEAPKHTAGWDVRLWAFSHYHLFWMSSRYEDAIVTDLRTLPSAILGALDGCIGGSPLAPLCTHYVAQRVARTIGSLETQKAKWLMEGEWNIRRAWPEWCVKAEPVYIR